MKRLGLILFFQIFIVFSCNTTKAAKQEEKHSKEALHTSSFRPIAPKEALISIHIIDRNGLSETIAAKEKLKLYQNSNFLQSQPYQKVLRVYAKDKQGIGYSIITSYHTNGCLKQYLEVVNGRAHGSYAQWHENGCKKLIAHVIQGIADIDPKSQMTWSFDGISYAWNEQGKLVTEIPYSKGVLHGTARYFHANGALAKEIPYKEGEIDGEMRSFATDGLLLEETRFKSDLQNGPSNGFWPAPSGKPAWQEEFQEGLLKEGHYFDNQGKSISSVTRGTGRRVIFDDNGPKEFHEFKEGVPDGEVTILTHNRHLTCRYFLKNGQKHGLETRYYPQKPFAENQSTVPEPKLSIDWYEGKIHGTVKTWYDNGQQESQREMSQNMKQGMLTCWYRNGGLMLIEEYDRDKLVRGEYLKPGETSASSRVEKGKGVATLFDSDGNFNRKIHYQEGRPIEPMD